MIGSLPNVVRSAKFSPDDADWLIVEFVQLIVRDKKATSLVFRSKPMFTAHLSSFEAYPLSYFEFYYLKIAFSCNNL